VPHSFRISMQLWSAGRYWCLCTHCRQQEAQHGHSFPLSLSRAAAAVAGLGFLQGISSQKLEAPDSWRVIFSLVEAEAQSSILAPGLSLMLTSPSAPTPPLCFSSRISRQLGLKDPRVGQ
jgi:hypothetical protein